MTNRLIDYINSKLEQIDYYKHQINTVDVLHFIKEEVLACHDQMAKLGTDNSMLRAEVDTLRAEAKQLEAEITQLSQRPLATRCQELEQENLRLKTENEILASRQRDLASMGVFEDILRHPRTV